MAVLACLLVGLFSCGALAETSERGPQLFYRPPNSSQVQRPESAPIVENSNEAQFYQPSQQRQDVQTFAVGSQSKGTAGKLETLEPDAELLPGAQQPQNPPNPQIPVSPAGIPGLLPGQQVYIVHPQHQIYMNSLYPQIPNGYGTSVQQIPGYQQRFYIVQAQPTLGDGSFAAPAGFQTQILIDPTTGQQLTQPQYLQPAFQHLIPVQNQAQNIQQNPNKEPLKNAQEPLSSQIKNPEPTRNFAEQFQNFPEGSRNFIQLSQNYPGLVNSAQQQNAFQPAINYGGFQPQAGPGLQASGLQAGPGLQGGPVLQAGPGFLGDPALQGGPTGYPVFPFGRNGEVPYQGQRNDVQLTSNPLPFSRLGQLQGLQGLYPGLGVRGYLGAQAQGRKDFNIEDPRDDISTESNNVAETTKKSADSLEEAPQEPRVKEETKEMMEAENTTAMVKEHDGKLIK